MPIIGYFSNKKNGDYVLLGKTLKVPSFVYILPSYNTYTTMRCIFATISLDAGANSFRVQAWDTATQNESVSETLSGRYIIIPKWHSKMATWIA